jgi:hypothetical protein
MPKPKKTGTKRKKRKPLVRASTPIAASDLSSPPPKPTGEGQAFAAAPFKLYLLIGFWAAFSLVTLTFPNYRWMLPEFAKTIPFQQSLGASLILFLGLCFSASLFRDQVAGEDYSKGTAFFWLVASLGMAAFLCFHEAGNPMGNFSIDTGFAISLVRHSVDLSNHHSLFKMFYGICPIWDYSAMALSFLFPQAPSILIQRMTNGLLDLGAIYVLYLAGKEIGGRRMGVLTALLAAVSKALLVKIVTGYGTSGMTLAMGLAILLTLRLLERQGISDFIKWGLAVGFLAFCGPYFQPLLLFFVAFTFALLFFQKKGDPPGPLAWFSLAGIMVFFLYCSNAFSSPNWVDRLLTALGPVLAEILLGLFLALVFFQTVKAFRGEKSSRWTGWTAGAWCCAILAAPFLTDPIFLSRIKQFSLASNSGFLSMPYLSASFQRMFATFQYLFWAGGDRSDMSLAGDSYFGYPEVILIVLGLAFFLGRPSLKVFFLVLAAGVGASVHFFAAETHSARLMASTSPFLLLGAYGLNELLIRLTPLTSKRAYSLFLSLLLIGFWLWAAQGTFDRVYKQWADKPIGLMAVRNQAIQDVDKGFQVYLAPEYSDGDLSVLYEGHPVHLLHRNNPVTAGLDENPADVVVFMGMNQAERQGFEKAFPGALWSEVHNSDQDPGRSATAMRCQILFRDLSDPRQKIFSVLRISPPYWRRFFSATQAGLTFAFLSWEDRTHNVFDPVSPEVYMDWIGVRYRGLIHMAQAGEYEFHCKAVNRTQLLIDGKEVFDLHFYRNGLYWAPGKEADKVLTLGAGEHSIEVTTAFQRTTLPPDITLHLKGKPGLGQSLWSSFDF